MQEETERERNRELDGGRRGRDERKEAGVNTEAEEAVGGMKGWRQMGREG